MDDPTPQSTLHELRKVTAPTEQDNPFHLMVEYLRGVVPIENGDELLRRARPDVVRIALVSMPSFPVTTKKSWIFGEASDDLDAAAYRREIVAYPREVSQRLFDTFEAGLRAALRENPHVICFSELALPAEQGLPMGAAIDLAYEASRQHDVVIIAGTAHDVRTQYNTGYLFHPSGPRQGRPFHKFVSAVRQKEFIGAPAARHILLAKVAGLHIATMICLDIADYASIASVIKVGDGIDVLLVPCYTTKFEDMNKIANVASRALPGIVGMANAILPDTSAKHRQVAWFGKLRDPRDVSGPAGTSIAIVDVEYDSFRKDRGSKRPDAEMRWLFGRRDMPTWNKPYR